MKMAKGPNSLLSAESKTKGLFWGCVASLHLSRDCFLKSPRAGFNLTRGREEQGERLAVACCCVSWGKSKTIEFLFHKMVVENGLWRMINSSNWLWTSFVGRKNDVMAHWPFLSLLFYPHASFPHDSEKEERTRLSPGALQLLVGSLHGEGRLRLPVNCAQWML